MGKHICDRERGNVPIDQKFKNLFFLILREICLKVRRKKPRIILSILNVFFVSFCRINWFKISEPITCFLRCHARHVFTSNGLMHFEANQHVSTHQVVRLQSATVLEIENSSKTFKNYKVEGVNFKRNYWAFLILVDRYVSSFAVTYYLCIWSSP